MLKEAIFILKRRLKGRKAIKKYKGSHAKICRQIINSCFNGLFFQISTGNFANFYIRDFGMCVRSLLKLGYKDEVYKTLTFALSNYAEHGKVTTTITPVISVFKANIMTDKSYQKNAANKKISEKDYYDFIWGRNEHNHCRDFFDIAPDSLAFLLYSLRISQSKALVSAYKPFLKRELNRYFEIIVDKETGLVKNINNIRKNSKNKGIYFSSIKDHAIRNSSCYDNCMLGMISAEAKKLKLFDQETENPFAKFNYTELIKKYFWDVKKNRYGYFKDDLNNNVPTGDANVFPYWCGIFGIKGKNMSEEIKMLNQSVKAIQNNGLDKPFPLKYSQHNPNRYGNFLFLPSLFAPNYEGNAVWMHLGLCYLDVIADAAENMKNKKEKIYYKKLLKKYLNQYTKQINIYNNFLEVYSVDKQDKQAKPYTSLFYLCDDSMLWCCKYLEMIK
ncbi:MAG: hypothetical protein ABIG89_02740 [Candidatus Woesearchaeota archaeon]